jgi:predicted CopG family antitoxin
MEKTLTISIDEDVYYGLCKVIGKERISRFIEDLIRPHITGNSLEEGYKQMAADQLRENEALEWAEGTFRDIANETW